MDVQYDGRTEPLSGSYRFGFANSQSYGFGDTAIGSEFARTDKKTREAATDGFLKLVGILVGKAGTEDSRRESIRGRLDYDRSPDDVACGDRPGAVGGAPQRGGKELDVRVSGAA